MLRELPNAGSAERLPIPFSELRLRDAAGQIVVQVEKRRGTLLLRGQMQSLLCVLKENVRVIGSAVEMEETEIKRLLALKVLDEILSQPMGVHQSQAAGFPRQENGHAGHKQRARQLFDDGMQQRLQIGFRAESAAELDDGLAIVVTMTVEGAIDPALNAAL